MCHTHYTHRKFLVNCGSHGPCHVSCHPSNALVVASNYAGGAVSCIRVAPSSGVLLDDSDSATASAVPGVSVPSEPAVRGVKVIRHIGSGPHMQRQKAPHTHCAQFSADGRFLLVADLGIDQIITYAVTEAGAGAGVNIGIGACTSIANTEPGAGPRGLIWHPNGHVVYVVYELLGAIGVYTYDPTDGRLGHVGTVSVSATEGDGDGVDAECGGICMLRGGEYLYLAGMCVCVCLAL